MQIIIILIIIAAALATEALLYSKRGGKRLYYSASLEKTEVFEGDEITVTEELSNEKRLPLPYVKTEIVAPAELDLGVNTENSKERLRYVPSVFSLRGREKCRRVRTVKCLGRGVFKIGASTLYGGDLFGLAGFSLAPPPSETLTVLPTPIGAEDMEPRGRLLYGDILTRRFICRDPFLVSGAREYTGQEPMNSIFWNATAKTGKLMSLEKDHSTESRALIMLSLARRDGVPAPAEKSVCEALIKAAAFAVEEAENSGAEYALMLNFPGEELPSVGNGREFRLKQLRRLAAIDETSDSAAVNRDFLRNAPAEDFTDVFFITPVFSEECKTYTDEFVNRGIWTEVLTTNNEAEGENVIQVKRKR